MGLYGKKYKLNDLTVRAFLALTSVGLWGRDGETAGLDSGIQSAVSDIPWDRVDWEAVLQLAREQALVGIVASAFDAGNSSKVELDEGERVDLGFGLAIQDVMNKAQSKALAKKVYSIEQRGLKMESFIVKLFDELERCGLHPVLLKGQGVAQSYMNPLRRSPGDVDVLLNSDEYDTAKKLLMPKVSKVIDDEENEMHTALLLSGFIVELHGTLRLLLGKKIDTQMDVFYERIFAQKQIRTIDFSSLSGTSAFVHKVNLPEINIEVLYVFCHMLQHFFTGGIGLRQVCDLCRLLYSYRNQIDQKWLFSELEKLGLWAEWKAFGAMSVDYLGMKPEYMPFLVEDGLKGYGVAAKWHHKATRIMSYILSTGNMGKNLDNSYKKKYPYLVKKVLSLTKLISNFCHLVRIFPGDASMVSLRGVRDGMKDLVVHD